MPDAVKKIFDEEIAKLRSLEPAASEANVTRNYLDWLTQVFRLFIRRFEPFNTYPLDSMGPSHRRKLFNFPCTKGLK